MANKTDIKNQFKINEYLTLKLEQNPSTQNQEDYRTVIYVKSDRFIHCKHLAFQINLNEAERYDEIDSIDDIEKFDRNAEFLTLDITPEEEFWGHCSNLHAWADHQYDTRLLQSNLAFPLLETLFKAGDIHAKRVFKEEIAKRLSSPNKKVIQYLLNRGYHHYLDDEEIGLMRSHFLSGVSKEEREELKELEHRAGTKFFREYDEKKDTNMFFLVENNHVTEIYILGVEFTLPSSIKNFTHLKELTLLDTYLKEIPQSIGDLKYLERLQLGINGLTSLPETIGDLASLKLLDIGSNKLTKLPHTIGNLSSLKRMDAPRNNLSELPETIADLTSLEVMKVYRNELTNLPEEIGNLPKLDYLDLWQNNLSSLPKTLMNLDSLEVIRIGKNKFSEIPFFLFELPRLKEIDLRENDFDKQTIDELREKYPKINIRFEPEKFR